MAHSFPVPYVAANDMGWGPPSEDVNDVDNSSGNSSAAMVLEKNDDASNPNAAPSIVAKFAALPYAPFGRSDRLGRAADFANPHRGGGGYGYGQPQQQQQQNQQQGYNNNSSSNYRRGGGGGPLRVGFDVDDPDGGGGGESFHLVDTTKAVTTKRFVNPASKRRQHSQRLRQINARRQQSSGGTAIAGLDKMTGRFGGGGGRFGNTGGRGGGRGGGRSGGPGGRGGYYNNRVDRQPSVAVQPDWKLMEEIDLSKLTKNLTASTTVPVPQDVLWCGFLDPYNEVYDKISARQPHPLKRMEHKEFYPVTTTDDPVLEKLAVDGAGQVFITDTILAHLMTCTRSVYPWDVVVQKLPGGTLFFDKRDNSQFDYLTVQETAYAPPADEDGLNTPERLGLEATMINQNFSQQILKKTGRKEMDLPNPFFDEDDNTEGMEPASTAFRYRKFALDDKMMVVCRTELHGLVKKTQYMTAFALNEYTPTPINAANAMNNNNNNTNNSSPAPPTQISWREKIDSQRGAVLATELKNNSFKLAKWTAQSLLAGADQMKIGFVSRTNPKNAYEHVILATQFYRPSDFAQQITLQEGQMWSIFRMFVTLMQKQEDGKYVLMRNPNKPVMHLYKVPADTFEEEE